jgi:hypothetical protein
MLEDVSYDISDEIYSFHKSKLFKWYPLVAMQRVRTTVQLVYKHKISSVQTMHICGVCIYESKQQSKQTFVSCRNPFIRLYSIESLTRPDRSPAMNSERTQEIKDKCGKFRVLIIGRANAGKTTILQRVCNTTEDPEIYNIRGEKVGCDSD